ncbi:MAG: hypothetical protein ABIQ49_12705 [Gemmatimonadales bacterium]
MDSITIARYAKVGQVEEVLARAGMKSDWPAEPEDTGRVLIHVSVGVGAEERAAELVRDAGLLGRQRLAPVSANAATSGSGGPGPGAVLSQDAAEAVTGRPVVASYRVQEGGALADPGGRSCAYDTGKPRALVLTPHFSDGAGEMRFIRGAGRVGSRGGRRL